MNRKMNYEEEEQNLAARSAAFVQYLTRRGFLISQKNLNEDAERRRQEFAKKAYHNTELLLESYRDIVWTLEHMPEQIASELQMPFATLDELIERVDLEIALNNKRLEERINSIVQSRVLIDRINEALTVLKTKPKEGKELYDIIYHTYIAPEAYETVWELFRKLNLSKRKYYEHRKRAIRLVSLRLWSAPDKEINMWLDVLTILDKKKD